MFICSQKVAAEAFSRSGFYIATGNSNVTVNEIVYRQSTSVKDYKLSHLIWKTQNTPLTTLGVRQRITDFIILNLEGRSLSNQNKSVMDDYDWLYTNTSDWSDWSHHEDTLLSQDDTYDLNITFTLVGNKKGYFSILTGYKKETIAWKSYGGTYVYSSSSFRDSSGSFVTGSPAIDYKQEYTLLRT
jgi:outer membrane protease